LSKSSPKNIAASVRQKLLNKSRLDKRPFNELLQYYAMERFLYRLSQSSYADNFILKGALMLRAWKISIDRPTMDIDMLGKTSNDIDQLIKQFHEICSVTVESDGLVFDLDSFKAERITEDADYEGVCIRFICRLERTIINMQIDIGFGDIIYPEARKAVFPTILDFPAPEIICYSLESTIAEKFEAMITLGELNSRMKDFYDIWFLSRQFNFEGDTLLEAIDRTLKNRETEIPEEITPFTDQFIHSKETQWKAFCHKLDLESLPDDFNEIMVTIKIFLEPIVRALKSKSSFSTKWTAPGPWK